MHFPEYLLSCLALFSRLSIAQVNSAFNPLANPGCATVESIVESCAPKIATEATVSSVVFSCICYDNSGNYAPTIYGNAASTCTDYTLSAFSTTGNAFVQYAAGFCTDPSFAPVKTTLPVTTPTATGVGAGGSNSAAAQTTTSTTATVLPGGSISIFTSSPTTSSSGSTATNKSPTTTKGSSSISASGSSSVSGAGGSVSSTSSKAEGAKMVTAVRDESLWPIFGSLLAALFVL